MIDSRTCHSDRSNTDYLVICHYVRDGHVDSTGVQASVGGGESGEDEGASEGGGSGAGHA